MRGQRLAAVLGLVDREVERFQDVARDLADHLGIVDDQAAFHPNSLPFGCCKLAAIGNHKLKRSGGLLRGARPASVAVDQQHQAAFRFDHARRDAAPAGRERGADGATFPSYSTTSSTVDQQGIRMTVHSTTIASCAGPLRRSAELQRSAAVDHGEHAAAKRGKARDVGGARGTGVIALRSRPPTRRRRRDRDALAGDGGR
jgi:hypothetical protein